MSEAVARAIRAGELQRQPCSWCGNPKTHAHHEDYSKPLVVIWLCARCHKERHRELAGFLPKQVTYFRMEAELKRELEQAAENDGRTVSSLVRAIIYDWLKTRGE